MRGAPSGTGSSAAAEEGLGEGGGFQGLGHAGARESASPDSSGRHSDNGS